MLTRLNTFLEWFLRSGEPSSVIEHRDYPGVSSDVLFRSGPYQIERVTIAPNTTILAHRHSHFDSWEIVVSGELARVSGIAEGSVNAALSMDWGWMRHGERVKICSQDWHGCRTSGRGAVVLSVQHWRLYFLSGTVPTFAGENWEGTPL